MNLSVEGRTSKSVVLYILEHERASERGRFFFDSTNYIHLYIPTVHNPPHTHDTTGTFWIDGKIIQRHQIDLDNR